MRVGIAEPMMIQASAMKRPIASIAGTGRSVPRAVMTNFDFAKLGIDTTDEWITERTGIKQRHIARDGESIGGMLVSEGDHSEQLAPIPDHRAGTFHNGLIEIRLMDTVWQVLGEQCLAEAAGG